MACPFCGSENVDIPMVDIGVGEQQCGPATCVDCLAGQDSDGTWLPGRDVGEAPDWLNKRFRIEANSERNSLTG